jgi:hypothetical protein
MLTPATRQLRGLTAALSIGAFCAFAATTGSALAAPVRVLGSGGHVSVRNDPFLTTPAISPAPAGPASAARVAAAKKPNKKPKVPTVASVLKKLRTSHAIAPAEYTGYLNDWNAAQHSLRRLAGTRATELGAVIGNLQTFAARGQLTAPRLPVLFETLDRNRQWWTQGSLLSYGARVQFSGSQLVWEYYPGQGIELQVLGTFGAADGMYTAGPSHYNQMLSLVNEMIPLAVKRGGGLAWEYYFSFDGGSPPWTSAMSQGTAIEALTRAYEASHQPSYLAVASRALAIFSVAPPTGVGVRTSRGIRYLQYSFAPGAAIINAFLQTLIGLYDYAKVSGNPRASHLFALGNAEALAEVPHYDTGAWSLYQPGQEDTLDYHELVTGFLQQLCDRTGAQVYCTTANDFTADLKTLPQLTLLTHRTKSGKSSTISFDLSKISRVGIVIVHNGKTVFLTSAPFPYGEHSFSIPPLKPAGIYTVRLAATDLAGNFNRTIANIKVAR